MREGITQIRLVIKSFLSSYVIKEVRVNDMSDDELVMTQREATVLARCKHVNIIRYKESFIMRDPVMMYLVMEYADGGIGTNTFERLLF